MSGIHLERKSRFWLDDIFDFSTTNDKETKKQRNKETKKQRNKEH